MKRIPLLLALCCAPYSLTAAPNPLVGTTFCNPINIPYRFQDGEPNWRQAADPEIFVFKGTYYLFASKSLGYWWSNDMNDWQFVEPKGLNIDKYAPAVFSIKDTVYYTSSDGGAIYQTKDLKGGQWSEVAHVLNWADPAGLVDDDGKVYMYIGSGERGTIQVVQLDPENKFKVIGSPVDCLTVNTKEHGFENRGDNNEKFNDAAWIEGAWATKHNGKYYLQYAVPATQERSYADGCYVSDSPMGPFTFAPNSPVSFKPLGFMNGLGHGSTFQDLQQKYWHITCAMISHFHMFERRLAIFPAAFDAQGLFHCDTYMTDYPQYLPGKAPANSRDNRVVGCMLLSYGKKATASSSLPDRPVSNAFDEETRTWWSAASSDPGESLTVDLGRPCEVAAIQTNFAEQDTVRMSREAAGKISHKYSVEGSLTANGPFTRIIDQTRNERDVPHDYITLPKTVQLRFLRITNAGPMPAGGKFAIRDFRVFGNGNMKAPSAVSDFTVARSTEDPRMAAITWKPVEGAEGYIIRYGIAPDKLYNNFQIWGGDVSSKEVRSLNIGVPAHFAIDSYNTSGVTPGTVVKK